MNSDPEHFETYFLRADPNLKYPFEVTCNQIKIKTEEGFAPGILNKTLLGMEALESRLDEFDFVIRTNLSSFFVFPNLLRFLQELPREKCYAGICQYVQERLPFELKYIPFVSGAGIYLSTDLVRLLISDHKEFEKYKASLPDDVFLGLFYWQKGIRQKAAQRWDYPTYPLWLEHNHKIEKHAYHFRAKYSYDFRKITDPFRDELLTLRALLRRYYAQDIKGRLN